MWRAFFIMYVYYAFVCPEHKGVIYYCPKEKNVKDKPSFRDKMRHKTVIECKASTYRRTLLCSVESWGRCYEVIISSLELMFWQCLT